MTSQHSSSQNMLHPSALALFQKHAFHSSHKTKQQNTPCTNSSGFVCDLHFGCTSHFLGKRCSQDTCIAFPGTHCTFDLGGCLELHCAYNARKDSLMRTARSSHRKSCYFVASPCTRLHAPDSFCGRCLGTPDKGKYPHAA